MAINRNSNFHGNPEFPVGQQWYVKPILSLTDTNFLADLKEKKKGMCFGLTQMLIAAFLAGDHDIFKLRMEMIRDTSVTEFPQLVEQSKIVSNDILKQIHEKFLLEKKIQNDLDEHTFTIEQLDNLLKAVINNEKMDITLPGYNLSPKKLKQLLLYALLEMDVFAGTLLVHQMPEKFRDFFPPNINLNKQNIEITSPVVMSNKLEDQGGLVVHPVFSAFYPDSNSFSCVLTADKKELFANNLDALRLACQPIVNKYKELKIEISELEESLLQKDNEKNRKELKSKQLALKHMRFPIALQCLSHNHAIPILFDAATNWFMICNPNHFPPKVLTDDAIANSLIAGFSKNGVSIFTIAVITTKANEDESKALIENWQSSKAWTDLYTTVNGKDINQLNSDGISRLNLAAEFGEYKIVKLLIKNGANVNLLSPKYLTPLMSAVQYDHQKVAKLLIKHGADVNLITHDGDTALIAAADNYDMVKWLVEECGAKLDLAGHSGKSALVTASLLGNIKIVDYLIKKGAMINLIGHEHDPSALAAAAQEGHMDIIKLLLSHGADAKQILQNGVSILQMPARNGKIEIVKFLISEGAKIDFVLAFAALGGHYDIAEFLINYGADVNQMKNDVSSALYNASQNGHQNVVKLLLEKGADVNQIQGNGASALYIASQDGHLEVVKLLLNKKILIDSPITAKCSVLLEFAAEKGREKEIKALLTESSFIIFSKQKVTLSGFTPLFAAVFFGHLEIVRELLKHGADINQKAEGISLMEFAKTMNHTDIVRELQNAFANKNVNQPAF